MTSESEPGLHQLLSTNLAPDAREAAYAQLQINHITSQILQLRSRLAKLEEQLRLHRAVLSPVRRIPAEILGEIFVAFLPDASEHGFQDKLVHIQLVCKKWRDAARVTHRLWCTLRFEDVRIVPFKKVEQWFNRAGSILKSLHFSAGPHNGCTSQSVACGSLQSSAFADLLRKLKGTLYHLSLEYSSPGCFQNLLNSMEVAGETSASWRSFDDLKSFTLKLEHEWSESPDLLQSMFLHIPPNITTFELRMPDKWSSAFNDGLISTDNIPLPLPQNLLERLSSFTLFCNWDGTRWLEDALSHCINVESLTMNVMSTVWFYDHDDP